MPDPAKVSREKIAFLLALHQVMMGGLDARQIGMIGAAIRAVYAKAARAAGQHSRASRCSRTSCAPRPRKPRTSDAVDVAATLRNLADRLAEYCGEGTYAYLLDRETTVPADAPLVVFDTRRCPESELRLVMFALMEYVTATVERHWQRAQGRGEHARARRCSSGRSIMLIDEAWHLISRPETGEYANNLARRARHLGLVLIVMSQQLSDFDTEHGVALLGNSSQQLLLAQNPKEIPFIADTLQLSEREAAELAAAEDGQGPPRADAVAQRHPRPRQGRAAGRPDRVLGVHLRPDRGQAIREAEIARHDGNVWAAIAHARQARHPRAPRPKPTRPSRSAGNRSRPHEHGDTAASREPSTAASRDEVAISGRRTARADRPTVRTRMQRRTRRRAPRAAAGGVRAVRRRRREHARLPDRARRRTARDRSGAGGRHRRTERRDLPATPASQAPRSLIEAAEHVAAGLPPAQLFATTADGLRVLATGPRLTPDVRARGRRAAARARARALRADRDRLRHARPRGRPARAREASHVAWVLPATAGGVRRGATTCSTRSTRTCRAARCSSRATTTARRRRALRELERSPSNRRAPLILLPSLPDLTTGNARRRRSRPRRCRCRRSSERCGR